MIEGTAEIWLGKESAIVKPNQSVLVPAGARHGFRNLENTTLHVRATLAAPSSKHLMVIGPKHRVVGRPITSICKTPPQLPADRIMAGG